jgi:hypothetical protein
MFIAQPLRTALDAGLEVEVGDVTFGHLALGRSQVSNKLHSEARFFLDFSQQRRLHRLA